VSFRVRHLGISWVIGTFHEWVANIDYDPERPELASVTARIEAGSLDTGHPRRDADVRRHYLDVEHFPAIVFTSTKVERVGLERLRVTGDLTINDVTRSVVLDTEVRDTVPQGHRTAFSATTTIYRQDFGILQNSLLERMPIVGDEVEITIEMETARLQ
jgi:polyisoprenoid-binding protein YceI